MHFSVGRIKCINAKSSYGILISIGCLMTGKFACKTIKQAIVISKASSTTFVPIHDWAHTTEPTHVCAHTCFCPDTFAPRHVCAQTCFCPDTFAPRHVCAQTRLCPDTFMPRHVCAQTRLCPDTIVPRDVCARHN